MSINRAPIAISPKFKRIIYDSDNHDSRECKKTQRNHNEESIIIEKNESQENNTDENRKEETNDFRALEKIIADLRRENDQLVKLKRESGNNSFKEKRILNAKISNLKHEKEILEKQIIEQNEKSAQMIDETQQLTEENQKIKNENHNLIQEIRKLSSINDEVQEGNIFRRTICLKLEKDVKDLQKKNNELLKEIQENKKKIIEITSDKQEMLKSKQKTFEDFQQNAKEKYGKLKNRYLENKKYVQDLTENNKELVEKIKEREKESPQLKEKIKILREKISLLKSENDEQIDKINDYETEIQNMNENNSILVQKFQDFTEKSQETIILNNELTVNNEKLVKKNQKLKKENQEFKSEIFNMAKDNQELSAKKLELSNLIIKLTTEGRSLNLGVHELESKNLKLLNKNHDLEEENQELLYQKQELILLTKELEQKNQKLLEKVKIEIKRRKANNPRNSFKLKDSFLRNKIIEDFLNEFLICLDGTKVGHGGQGNIYSYKFAAKRYFYSYDQDRSFSSIINEFKIMQQCNHPNILKVFYLIKRKDENESENEEQYNDSEEEDFSSSDELTTCDYYIIEELCKYDLEKFIHISQKKRNGINSQTKKKIINQIVDAMCHCHSQEKKIIHRDLKTTNILITENEDVKICDFGCAKILENELNNTPGVGTPLYMAPELYMNDGYIYDEKIDIYSFGYILCYILSDGAEFETASLQEKAKNIKPIIDNVITDIEARNLIYQCWELQPENRPSFEEIKSRINLWSFE